MYECLWRNKWLTSEAKTIDDMIEALQGAADTLREMKKAGVTLSADEGGMEDDYARLVTDDKKVARKFKFQKAEVYED